MKTLLAVILLCRLGIAQLPEDPKPQPKHTELVLASYDYLATTWDAYTSASFPGCHYEMNPLYGHHPSTQRYYGQMLAQTTAVTIVAHLLTHHGHRKLAYAGWLVEGSLHVEGGVQNTIICRK